jgi:eukaryotic-like serine/threonine-protein kinase
MELDEMIGVSLGSYRVTSKVGQGGMGAVYLAEHPVLGRKAAVKVLLPELSQQTEAVKRFFDEARTTARLRHPALVDVFDYGTLPDGRAYLIMDFLEGECLEERIRTRGTLSVNEALGITRQIALGVSVAHGEQIVHRDLKPDNIFLLPPVAGSPEERVKILDFGIAKLARPSAGPSLTLAGVVMGTPLYMSPEQCRGDLEVDHRADVYSLGCILFSMLAGRPPFIGESMLELIALHQYSNAPTLASLGVQVDEAVERLAATMLAKAAADRFPSMLAVAEAIDGLLVVDKPPISGSFRRSPSGEAPATDRRRTPDGGTRLAGRPDSIAPMSVTPFLPRRSTPHSVPERAPARRTSTAIMIIAGVAALLVLGFVALRARVRPVAVRPAETRAAFPAPAVQPVAPAPPPREAPPPVQPAPAVATPAPPVQPAVKAPAPPARPRGRPRAPVAEAPEAPAERPGGGLERELEDHPRPKTSTPKTTRPIYKGTQLDIEKKSPY